MPETSGLRSGAHRVDQIIPREYGCHELFGGECSGKTTLAYGMLREAHLADTPAVLINTTGFPDKEYLASRAYPGCPCAIPHLGESVFDFAAELLLRGVKLIVIDSTAGIDSVLNEFAGLRGGDVASARSRLLYHGTAVLSKLSRSHSAHVILLSETRAVLSSRGTRPATTPMLKGVLQSQIRLTRTAFRTEYGAVGHSTHEAKVIHSASGPPSASADFLLMPGIGVDRNLEILIAGIEAGVITLAGAYLRYSGRSLGPGYSAAANSLPTELYEQLRVDIDIARRETIHEEDSSDDSDQP